jgi:hypothetical protein
MLTILVPVAVIAVIVIIGVLAFQRGRDGFDLSGNTVLRAYLYLGSFAGVIAMAFGLSALLNGVLATAVGNDFVYGSSPSSIRPCPMGVDCPLPETAAAAPLQNLVNLVDRRRLEDLVRGGTFTVFGVLFYGAHRWARGAMYPRNVTVADHGGLRRAYLLVGTIVFGVGAIALFPAGVYQIIANAILPTSPNLFRPGVADTLTGGVVSLVIWLLYLRAVLRDARGGGGAWVHRRGPAAPPGEGAPVGAPIGPRPSERWAGAEAQPPQEFRRDRFVRPGERIVRVGRPGEKPREPD